MGKHRILGRLNWKIEIWLVFEYFFIEADNVDTFPMLGYPRRSIDHFSKNPVPKLIQRGRDNLPGTPLVVGPEILHVF